MPLSEIITDFYDKLKSVSSGFASLNYELIGFRETEAVKLEILLASEEFESLSRIVPRQKAEEEGRAEETDHPGREILQIGADGDQGADGAIRGQQHGSGDKQREQRLITKHRNVED